MTMLEYLSKNAQRLAEFLELMQSDGLQANGCSLNLLLPTNETGSWKEWLETDNPNEDEYDISAHIDELRRLVDAAAIRKARPDDG